jgi:Predicted hydrolases of the HAD superfamily
LDIDWNEILVASDYDRTLANEESNFVISPIVVQKINEFSKKYKFVVVSGREKKFMDKLAVGLRPTAWILENGSLIFFDNKEFVLCEKSWFERDREKIIEILDNLKAKYSIGRVIIYIDGLWI